MTATDPAGRAPGLHLEKTTGSPPPPDEHALRVMVARLQHLAASTQAGDLSATTAAGLLAVHVLTCHGAAPPSPPRHDVRVQRVIELLHANVHTALKLADIAAVAGLSRFHLLRLFQQQTGETPARFHLRLRIELGQGLLRTTRVSITEIAGLCGFVDPSHFSKTFRRHTGMSPSRYRAALRQ
jgi:AraC family transcriptional regulator